jgi:hypothetical protein
MEDLVRAVVVLVLGNFLLVPFVLVLGALFPRRLRRTRQAADLMPGRAFLVGLINALFFSALALALSALADRVGNDLPRILAILIFAALSLGLSFGLAGVAQLAGERLRPQDGEIRRAVWGTLALSLGCALPFVGWFGLLPYAGCLGLGALIVGFFYQARLDLAPGPQP